MDLFEKAIAERHWLRATAEKAAAEVYRNAGAGAKERHARGEFSLTDSPYVQAKLVRHAFIHQLFGGSA